MSKTCSAVIDVYCVQNRRSGVALALAFSRSRKKRDQRRALPPLGADHPNKRVKPAGFSPHKCSRSMPSSWHAPAVFFPISEDVASTLRSAGMCYLEASSGGGGATAPAGACGRTGPSTNSSRSPKKAAVPLAAFPCCWNGATPLACPAVDVWACWCWCPQPPQ